MKLLTLTLKDFKGIRNFTLDANGENIHVFGANGAGKTSLADGIRWILFNKDTTDKTEFGIKTLNKKGVVIPAITHEAEAVFSIDGKKVTLKKEYSEKYTQKRGTLTDSFTGHETLYFIDGVPKSKKEYDKFISDIINEDVFKLLTSPLYFNEQLHWKDRRKTLLNICGDISDSDVILSDKKLSDLPAILQGRTIEDHRKIIDARRTKINDEIKKIPVRIDEANRSLPDISGIDAELLNAEIFALTKTKQSKEQEISRIQSGGEISEQQRLLRESESRLLDISTQYRAKTSDIVFAKKKQLQELQLKSSGIDGSVLAAQKIIKSLTSEIETITARKAETLSEWRAESASVFDVCLDDTCPTCKQSLPADQLEVAREKALAQFNLNKSQKVASLFANGTKMKADIDSKEEEIRNYNASINKLAADKNTLQLPIDSLQSEIDNMGEIADIATNSAYVAELAVKQSIQSKITSLKENMQSLVDGVNNEIANIEAQISVKKLDILKLEQLKGWEERIAELHAQEKKLNAEREKLDFELSLIEQFIRTKVTLLEDRISAKFKHARFKMFEVQVNGELNETCETLGKDLVPYSSGLNQAAKINIGLDIINTLSDYYNFYPMIFVDNRESVTDLIDVKAQVISLVVSPVDAVLRVV